MLNEELKKIYQRYAGRAIVSDDRLYFIPNTFHITSANNNLRYSSNGGETWNDINIQEGEYEFCEICKEIYRQFDQLNSQIPKFYGYPIEISSDLEDQKTIIILNTYANSFQVDLTVPNSIGSTLGFEPQILTDEYNVSENEVKFTRLGTYFS